MMPRIAGTRLRELIFSRPYQSNLMQKKASNLLSIKTDMKFKFNTGAQDSNSNKLSPSKPETN